MSLSFLVDCIVDVLGVGFEVVFTPYLWKEVLAFNNTIKGVIIIMIISMNEDTYWYVKYLAWAFDIHSKTYGSRRN